MNDKRIVYLGKGLKFKLWKIIERYNVEVRP